MGTDKKPERFTAIVKLLLIVCVTLDCGLLALGFGAPELAARDVLSPRRLVFLPSTLYTGFIISGAVGLALLLTRLRVKSLAAILLAISTGACLGVHQAGMFRNEGSRFLATFSERIRGKVGVDTLNQLFVKLGDEVRRGERVGSVVHYRELPPAIRSLFSSTAPTGNLAFTDKDVYSLRILWGGPFFRWGVEVWRNNDKQPQGSPTLLSRQLSTNVVAFIAQ